MSADANRWLGEIQKASFEAVSPDPLPVTERRAWTVRAVEALEGSLAAGALEPRDVVPRLANLSYALARHAPGGRPEELHPALAADELVRRCLELAGMSPDEAAATEWALREEDVPVMRTLRWVRNAVAPAVRLLDLDLVTGEDLRNRLAAWRDVLPRLP